MTVSSPIDMAIFREAIHTWFTGATGLDTIWAAQSAPQPEYPFGSLQIVSGPNPVSPSWETRDSTDLSRAAGREVAQERVVPCTFNISCQALVGMPEGRFPTQDALFYMNKALAALTLPSFLTPLREANISVMSASQINNISSLIGGSFAAQAELEPKFGASLSVTEYAGYIKTVHGTSTPASGWGIDQIFGDV